MRLRSLLLAAVLFTTAGQSVDAASVNGVWFTHKAKAKVQITKCGAGLCGRIVWLRQAHDSRGRPVLDERNRNRQLRKRPVLGLRTFTGLQPMGPGRWTGLIYNPEDGRTYRANLMMSGTGAIRVEGCRVGGSACGARNWVRAH
jgi:uncharacterized protein (DUF2147 family)